MRENPISSLWFTWYLLSDLDGRLQRVRRTQQLLIALGIGLAAWERQMLAITESLDDALRHAQRADIDINEVCPDLLPIHTLPWPARGLHLWWSTRDALAEAEALTQSLRRLVAHAIQQRIGDSDPDPTWFAEGEGTTASRRGRGSLNRRSTSSRVIAAG